MPKVGIIIQARLGSTRLPEKVLKPISGRPMLQLLLERVQVCQNVGKIVVATTTAAADDRLAEYCETEQIVCFRGSQENVLERYLQAAALFGIDPLVRITGDCPLVDPNLIEMLIEKHQVEQNDYTSNVITRTFPRGLDAEVVNYATLERVKALADEPHYFEHVTLYIYTHPELFQLSNLSASKEFAHPEFRLTVDTAEDFQLMEQIYQRLYQGSPIDNRLVLKLLQDDPELASLNRHIQQKKV